MWVWVDIFWGLFCFCLIISFVPTDLASSDMWQGLQGADDPELAQLARRLPDTVLSSRASSTTKKYHGTVERWKSWAVKKGLVSLPVEGTKFALYLQHVGDTTKSKAAVVEAVNAVSWLQRLTGQDELVSQHPLVSSVVEGFQRLLAKPKTKKQPITPDILRDIVASLGQYPSLSELRLAAISLLAYVAFLRFDELRKLRGLDVKFQVDRLELHIISSKTDQYRQGATLLIARTGLPTCPVVMLERYVAVGNVDLLADSKLFRGIVATRKGERLRPSGSLSYTRMREIVRDKLCSLGYDHKVFGLHSFRAGGATAAANTPGISERNFKRHGRWKSDSAKDGYVEDSESSRLMVSKSLGI